MQPRESRSSWHFNISMIKSALRICAALALMYADRWYFNAAGGLLFGAEILGIVEEF